jgi:pimeloyl-ACP methyl ester carboxylesterase
VDKNRIFPITLVFIFGVFLCTACGRPDFEKAECQFDTRGIDIECGYLSVPENRAQEDSPMIQLHVAIIRSKNPKAATDPVVILHGGPGGYALDMMDYWLNIFNHVRADRDLIVLDQRGVGYSRPSLNCPEAEDQWYQGWTQDLSAKDSDQAYTQALALCHDRLVASGIDLSAYTSASNSADVNDLRLALGYSRWNLYGSSYGTRLALTIMRDFPEEVRSVVLDSVYPPRVDLFAEYPRDAERSLELLFERCAADAECNQAYPNLKAVFYKLVDQLDAEPRTFKIQRPLTDQVYEMILNGDRLIWVFFQLFYMTPEIPLLPGIIYALQEGGIEGLSEPLVHRIFSDDHWSEGMYFSVECSEEAPFSSLATLENASVNVSARFNEGINGANSYQFCGVWGDVLPAAQIENLPVVSDIPTLILAGEFDPVTPPTWGRLAAETLSRSQFLEFPGFGHGVLGSGTDRGTCSRQVVADFLADPESPVDASCVADFELVFVK